MSTEPIETGSPRLFSFGPAGHTAGATRGRSADTKTKSGDEQAAGTGATEPQGTTGATGATGLAQ